MSYKTLLLSRGHQEDAEHLRKRLFLAGGEFSFCCHVEAEVKGVTMTMSVVFKAGFL